MAGQYLCIDLKSFYASVECVERGLDPMTAKLVVADPERSKNTICLAVSPALKAQGVKNRCRLGDIPLTLEFIVAPPRMQKYIDYSAAIYGVYLRYLSKEDMHVYSIDETFLDVTRYLSLYGRTVKEMAELLMGEVLRETGIRATCGVGTNLYLAKIALDIMAKHAPDFIGVLDEEAYRKELWDHRPLTDFWRIGRGTAERLAKHGLFTMRDVACAPEKVLYTLFGVDAELLIDHAWGREPVTIADIRRYRPKTSSLSSGQVLMRDYAFEEGKLIVKEMMDLLCLDLTARNAVTDSLSLYVGYAKGTLPGSNGMMTVEPATSAASRLIPAIVALYERLVDRKAAVRRVSISCNNLTEDNETVQTSLFEDSSTLYRDKALQKTVLTIKERYGKDAILKGMNYQEAATTRERNHQIGGHKSGL